MKDENLPKMIILETALGYYQIYRLHDLTPDVVSYRNIYPSIVFKGHKSAENKMNEWLGSFRYEDQISKG